MSDPSRPESDRSFDLSLRFLTAIVMVGLAASIGFLAWLEAGRFLRGAPAVVAIPAPPPVVAPQPVPAETQRPDEVLMAPNRVFRCIERGKVAFSDKACPPGTEAPAR